jgi:hypothetical protein
MELSIQYKKIKIYKSYNICFYFFKASNQRITLFLISNLYYRDTNLTLCKTIGLIKAGLFLTVTSPMRPKARGLAQQGDPPCWLEESDPAGVILYGPYCLPFPYRTGFPDRSCPAAVDGISSCC